MAADGTEHEMPYKQVELAGEVVKFYRHYSLFITDRIEDFESEYNWRGKKVDYDDVNEVYHTAAIIYESYLGAFRNAKRNS